MVASTKHRRHSAPLVRWLMTDPDSRDVGRKLANCALRLQLEASRDPDAPPDARLTAARVCNHRLCPYCEWRRSRVYRARLLTGAALLLEQQPKLKPLMLTLTLRNVPVDGLRDTLAQVHAAWSRMTKRAFFPTELWYRRTEVTISDPAQRLRYGAPVVGSAQRLSHVGTGEITTHPHLHCLLFVPPRYFGRGYVRTTEWAEHWRQCLGVDYTPIVDVRRAYDSAGRDVPAGLPISAVMEASKYITKQADLPKLGPLVGEFGQAVRGVRMRSISKALGQFVADREVTAADLLDQPLTVAPDAAPPLKVVAEWCDALRHYVPTASGGGG